jgi:hypothetical protein
MKCRHCGKNKAISHRRNLCYRCCKDPTIRVLYPLKNSRYYRNPEPDPTPAEIAAWKWRIRQEKGELAGNLK